MTSSAPSAPSSSVKDATASTVGKKSQSSHLLAQLRHNIVTGQLAPGVRLVVSSLAEAVGAGQTPVREALMRLASENFVRLDDQRGFSVAPISRLELQHLTDARVALEALIIELAIHFGDDIWEGKLISSFHLLQKHQRFTDDAQSIHPEWDERHKSFHRALISACPNAVLLELYETLHRRSERYRHLAVHYLSSPRNDLSEHEAILNACLKRDVGRSKQLLEQHIRKTAETIFEKLILP